MFNCNVDQLITNIGIWYDIKKMIIADFLTLQRDRHGGNIELLNNGKRYELSPLFDNGSSLLATYPSASGVDISKFDVLADYPVNNYIGTRSLYQNLKYIDTPIRVNTLYKTDKEAIFYDLDGILPKEYTDVIWKMLVYRYTYLRQRGFIIDG